MTLSAAVERGDLDELVRLVDGLCSAREWDRVVELRDRCRHALERGLQLWPAAEYAEYRIALEAPGSFAGRVVVEGAGRFALGPLWEVAASTHDWDEIGPHVPPGPARTMTAHERVLRGEDLASEGSLDPLVLELPFSLQPWEPAYPLATYRADEADFPPPDLPAAVGSEALPPAATELDSDSTVEALLDLGRVWAEQSNGSVTAVAVEGSPAHAVATLGVEEAAWAPLNPSDALAWMAWAGASGGAYGRRRGGPAGRFGAWWVVCELAGLEWPADPPFVGQAAGQLDWHLWAPPGAGGGWELRLAVADPGRGVAWAVEAVDSHREDQVLGSEA